MSDPQRILIIRPSALGDVCRSVPVVVSLRRAFSDATIDWVVRDSFADAVRSHPDLSDVIEFPRRRLASWWRSPNAAAATWKWFGRLRRRRYELVVDCQGLGRSALMSAMSGAPMRIGHADARELAWLAYNERVNCPPGMHAVERMLRLLDPLGIDVVRDMRLYVPPECEQWWQQRAREEGLNRTAYAVLAPTSRWPSKRWPIERWAELIEPLRTFGLSRCVVIGAPGEREQVRPLIDAVSARSETEPRELIDLVGATTVGQTMAVIAGSSLLIANDSAPLHMAVGLGVPRIGLFGPTNPDEVGPYNSSESVIRKTDASGAGRPHFKDRSLGDSMMRRIVVEDVLERVPVVLGCAESPRDGN